MKVDRSDIRHWVVHCVRPESYANSARAQFHDAVTLDHDVDRTPRRRAGAVDDSGASKHQAFERTDAAVAPDGSYFLLPTARSARNRNFIARLDRWRIFQDSCHSSLFDTSGSR